MRAVLDTNVLISGVIATGAPHKLLVKGFNNEYQTVVSVETLTEFRETLLKYPERFHMGEDEVQKEVETIRYFAEFVAPQEDSTAIDDDPDDDKVLKTAVAGDVVSGDRQLLSVDSFRGIDIIEPRTFYELLEGQ
jgi:putative PIN family toxin of toxin-antitoxin system